MEVSLLIQFLECSTSA